MTASTTDPIFITANARKADEVQRLLAGCGVRWGRVALTPVAGDDLAQVASARALEAYGRLGQRCQASLGGPWRGARSPRLLPLTSCSLRQPRPPLKTAAPGHHIGHETTF